MVPHMRRPRGARSHSWNRPTPPVTRSTKKRNTGQHHALGVYNAPIGIMGDPISVDAGFLSDGPLSPHPDDTVQAHVSDSSDSEEEVVIAQYGEILTEGISSAHGHAMELDQPSNRITTGFTSLASDTPDSTTVSPKTPTSLVASDSLTASSSEKYLSASAASLGVGSGSTSSETAGQRASNVNEKGTAHSSHISSEPSQEMDTATSEGGTGDNGMNATLTSATPARDSIPPFLYGHTTDGRYFVLSVPMCLVASTVHEAARSAPNSAVAAIPDEPPDEPRAPPPTPTHFGRSVGPPHSGRARPPSGDAGDLLGPIDSAAPSVLSYPVLSSTSAIAGVDAGPTSDIGDQSNYYTTLGSTMGVAPGSFWTPAPDLRPSHFERLVYARGLLKAIIRDGVGRHLSALLAFLRME